MARLHRVSEQTTRFLAQPRPFLVGEEWVRGDESHRIASINPATGEVIGSFHAAQEADALRAIEVARQSFDDGRWRRLTPAQRQKILWRVADLIDANAQMLAELECVDGGKLYAPTLQYEVPHAAETFRYYAGWCTKLNGHLFEASVPGVEFHGYVRHEPVGVVAQIIPWNGALVAASWKLAPALAAGCSVILKPAELSTMSVLYLGELLLEAGIPPGAVSILAGRGRVVGNVLATHSNVDKVAFTGSTAVGKSLLVAAQGNLKRLTLELGGKSPTLIFADADLAQAIPGAAGAVFSNAGQVCVAGSRVYAERSVYRDVCEGLAAIAAKLAVGPGLDGDSDMGPLISEAHRRSVHDIVSRSGARGGSSDRPVLLADGSASSVGRDGGSSDRRAASVGGSPTSAGSSGVEILTGGAPLGGAGFFYPATVVACGHGSYPVVQEEVFGPVVTVMPFDDAASAVRQANDSIYGLAASVWTRDLSRAHQTAAQIRSGIVWINSHGIPELSMPIGGMKQSGWGREHGQEGLMIYTEAKSVMVKL